MHYIIINYIYNKLYKINYIHFKLHTYYILTIFNYIKASNTFHDCNFLYNQLGSPNSCFCFFFAFNKNLFILIGG